MLYTASFYAPQDWLGQAYRVSRAHPRGRRTQWETQPYLYPSRPLLLAYRREELDFTALSQAYREELDAAYGLKSGFREWIEELPGRGDITLLCFENAQTPCHRRVAAQWLVEQEPGLALGDLR